MKKLAVVCMLMLIMGLNIPGISQSLHLSTDKGKTCKVDILVGQIKDNIFDLTLKTTWLSESDLKQVVVDKQSIVGFEKDKLFINLPNFLRLISPLDAKIITMNSSVKLTFEVSERFKGGEFKFKFPFFYATSMDAANDVMSREEFIFKRPRDYEFIIGFQQGDIIDKYPPLLAILTPEGVEDGLKPILDTTVLNVKVKATDATGIESVMINNVLASKENASIYSANISLRVGYENTIVASATDNRGKISKKQFPVECRQPQVRTIVAAATPQAPPKVEVKLSDVDIDIPEVATPDPFKFALIIGNEDYSSSQTNLQTESNVEFAIRDAEVFKEYAIKVFGVPEENIIFRVNAKVMDMQRALNQINSIAKNSKGKAEIYAFYAGHGFPDEQTKEPHLIPVDVSGNDLQFAIKLNDFYKKLTEFPTKRVTVFLDACFSGGGRNLSLIAARGVKVKPKEALLKGNLVVFAASSGEQSSLPYREKQHGIFTYYLLKKLKETSGDINLLDLSDYLSSEIGIRSVMINNKEQNPQTNISPALGEIWKQWKIK